MFAKRTSWNLQPNRFSAAVERVRSGRRELLDLTESNPTRVGLDYDTWVLEPLSSLAALEYRPDPRGLVNAREAIAAYYRERGALKAPDIDRIVLTTSTSEAYSFVLRLLCDPGDEVLVPAPSYPLLDFLASIQDVQLRPYSLIYDHGWHLDMHSLKQAVDGRSRALIVVHPNNPTGSFVKQEEMGALGELCREHELALVADEVFLDYALDGKSRPSFSSIDDALTFTLSGISKISALPQMKLAWIAVSGPEDLASQAMARLEVIADTYLSVSTPVQLGTAEFLSARHSIQQQLRDRLQANVAELDRQLTGGCTRLEIEGGWYAVLRVPAIRSDEDLAIELLEDEVIVHPGHFYDFPSEAFLVVSLINETEKFAEGVGRVMKKV
jgi:alanine-synthesizing transaminase